jgi:hypothetical protein
VISDTIERSRGREEELLGDHEADPQRSKQAVIDLFAPAEFDDERRRDRLHARGQRSAALSVAATATPSDTAAN